MHTVHAGFSIVAELRSGRSRFAKAILRAMLACPGQNAFIPFDQSESTLFASGIVLPAQDYHGTPLRPTLMLLTSFSGPFEAHLDELVRIGKPGLCALFQNCVDFPDGAPPSDYALKAFLKKHREKEFFYSGMHHITCKDIQQEEGLRREIKSFVDGRQDDDAFNNLQATAIREQIQRHIRSKGDRFAWAHQPCKKNVWDIWHTTGSAKIALVVAALILLGLLASAVLVFFYDNMIFKILTGILVFFIVVAVLCILYIEWGTHTVANRPSDKRMRLLASTQNHAVLNELTAVGVVKKGRLRQAVFKATLRLLALFKPNRIIPTIATARWIAANNGKRLVFISNFANTASSYVRDFIDSRKSAHGINLLFGHGEGFPKTKFLWWSGTLTDPEGFMNVFHQTQQVTRFWYCSCDNLSVDNINNNRAIRNGLFAPMRTKQIKRWLNRI